MRKPQHLPLVALLGLALVAWHSPVKAQAASAPAVTADIIFLVDSSWSIGKDNFQFVREFLYKVVKALKTGGGDFKFALVQYSGSPKTEFQLSTYSSVQDVLFHIWSMPYLGGRHQDRPGLGVPDRAAPDGGGRQQSQRRRASGGGGADGRPLPGRRHPAVVSPPVSRRRHVRCGSASRGRMGAQGDGQQAAREAHVQRSQLQCLVRHSRRFSGQCVRRRGSVCAGGSGRSKFGRFSTRVDRPFIRN
ncbi:collagen alpha-3(VI) chain-like [Erpetoichthys calabaricus]|uniref:collagen alpha-3(VI) chain-like n=1 Tax=Erpetoichthys calabaricus TaxID=27687 RepID=UPI0022348D02|nr:collagen alpha-3(VI) chain-like [Erpetoichthys calabaricus]